jgi:hypothetical protein
MNATNNYLFKYIALYYSILFENQGVTKAEWQGQQKSKKSSIRRCFNCGIRDHFVRDYHKP